MKNNFLCKIFCRSIERADEWQGSDYKKLNFTQSLDELLMQPYKVMLVDAFCDNDSFEYAYDPKFTNFDWEQIDLVLIKETLWEDELTIQNNFIQKNKIKNFIINSHNNNTEKNFYVPYWLLRPLNYGKLQNIIYDRRKYFFDVLLGFPRDHRFFLLAKLLSDHKILNKSIVTFRKEFLFEESQIDIIWRDTNPYIKDMLDNQLVFPFLHNMDCSWETSHLIDRRYFLDGIDIPWKIYENSWYSICNETAVPDNDPYCQIPRITEKTGRLFLAKRIFVMFGHRGNLSLLKDLGFLTFESIIDESYDLEHDPIIRYEKAWQQVEKLILLDPLTVYKDTEKIREHNFERMFQLRNELRNKANQLLINSVPLEFCA